MSKVKRGDSVLPEGFAVVTHEDLMREVAVTAPQITTVVRCCMHCGRWGTRQFIEIDHASSLYECSNDRACRRRQHRDEHGSGPIRGAR